MKQTKILLDKIYNSDCLDCLKYIPDGSVDLIISDPPYNLSFGNKINCKGSAVLKGMGGEWSKRQEDWDNYSLTDYFTFTEKWLLEAKRILKPSGSMWIFGTYHNIGIVNVICQKIGLEIINEVIWYKSNSFPNLAGRRLTASHENLLWCHNSPKKRKYRFNYEYSKNGDFSSDKLKNKGKQMRTVWSIPNNKEKWELKFGTHPTQKPYSIVKRIIELTTEPNDLIVVPFSGSGTECIAAKKLKRKYVGFEIDKKYYNLSLKRLKDA